MSMHVYLKFPAHDCVAHTSAWHLPMLSFVKPSMAVVSGSMLNVTSGQAECHVVHVQYPQKLLHHFGTPAHPSTCKRRNDAIARRCGSA